jgi:hypothetical protein
VKYCITIPSYHRYETLCKALQSIDLHLIPRLPDCEFKVFIYLQDATPNEQQALRLLQYPWLAIEYVEKQSGALIGEIIRQSIVHCPYLDWADYLILADDDIRIIAMNPNFPNNFVAMFDDMRQHDIAVGSAKLGLHDYEFRVSRFPEDDTDTPFKEKFIAVQCVPNVINTLFDGDDLDHIGVGEDLYIFLKSLIAGFSIRLYYGLTDFVHFEHEWQGRSTSGGFLDLVKELVGDLKGVNKYVVIQEVCHNATQDVLASLFVQGKTIRDDVHRHIAQHYRIVNNRVVTFID